MKSCFNKYLLVKFGVILTFQPGANKVNFYTLTKANEEPRDLIACNVQEIHNFMINRHREMQFWKLAARE